LEIDALPQGLTDTDSSDQSLEFPNNRLLIDLCGEFDRNLAQVEAALEVDIIRRGNALAVHGEPAAVGQAIAALTAMYQRLESGKTVEAGDVDGAIRMGGSEEGTAPEPGDQIEMFKAGDAIEVRTRKKTVEPRTPTQATYLKQLFSMFLEGHVDRIVLSRPAVEAGERLGFLPGDMKEKVDPFMQPLYDALNDFLPGKQVTKLIEDKRIEIAPLAFMRGRTLSNAFVVLDEGQNATTMQMKMFLTRLGEGSRMVITGDNAVQGRGCGAPPDGRQDHPRL